MGHYIYDGPVFEFKKCIVHQWRAETYAISEGKARMNMIYQFKTRTNRSQNAKISLPGKIVEILE